MKPSRMRAAADSTASTERRQKWRRDALKRRKCHAYIGMRRNLGCNGRGTHGNKKKTEAKESYCKMNSQVRGWIAACNSA
ncbi:hypothetical protein PVAP13_3NG068800 [Panicum virgatum]|uniref:Uncharacterized protein n=1 Tax=Panicum virgatum TaxID=38727 RepID=A0A8T0TSX6_PANVG|nr:hypothetical protein PVAP13_3NG068800 [Panicum virgatum]